MLKKAIKHLIMKKTIILVVPVYNEEKVIERSITRLNEFFTQNIKQSWKTYSEYLNNKVYLTITSV